VSGGSEEPVPTPPPEDGDTGTTPVAGPSTGLESAARKVSVVALPDPPDSLPGPELLLGVDGSADASHFVARMKARLFDHREKKAGAPEPAALESSTIPSLPGLHGPGGVQPASSAPSGGSAPVFVALVLLLFCAVPGVSLVLGLAVAPLRPLALFDPPTRPG
jgi:hypothetical protein